MRPASRDGCAWLSPSASARVARRTSSSCTSTGSRCGSSGSTRPTCSVRCSRTHAPPSRCRALRCPKSWPGTRSRGPAAASARSPPEENVMDYADYRHLTFEPKPNGVLLVTINRPEVLNAANARLHWEFTQVWLTVDADPKTRVVLVTGAGKAFSAGRDLALVEDMAGKPEGPAGTPRGNPDLVSNTSNLHKPAGSARNGVGGGARRALARPRRRRH